MSEKEYSRKGLLEAVKSNRLYDYIANHYTEMGTYDLKEVLLAVLGVCYDLCHGYEDEEALINLIEEELKEGRDFGGDEE